MTTQELIDQSHQRLIVIQDRLTHCSESAARYRLAELSDLILKELLGERPWHPETPETPTEPI